MTIGDKAFSNELMQAVESNFDEQVKFVQDLVRIPSQMRQEESAQALYADALSSRNYQVDRWTIDVNEISSHPAFSPVDSSYENSVNVVGVYQPKNSSGRSLILNGHIDVVPVGREDLWESDPYDPVVRGNWLYGRGSSDMKGGLAANIFALDALKRMGLQPAAPVFIQSVVEEECTGNGALACLVKGYRAEAAIITEPTHATIFNAGMGVIWFRVRVLGRSAIAADAGSGVNAIFAAYRLMQALREIEARWNDRKDQTPYADFERPVKLNVGRISGGDWPSSVPDWCTFDCRISIFPGVKLIDAQNEIEEFISNMVSNDNGLKGCEASVEYFGALSEGYTLPPNTLAESRLRNAHRSVLNAEAANWQFPGHVDSSVFCLYGDIPALVYGPVGDNIHGYNERVSLDSLKSVTAVLAHFIADWCGVERVA